MVTDFNCLFHGFKRMRQQIFSRAYVPDDGTVDISIYASLPTRRDPALAISRYVFRFYRQININFNVGYLEKKTCEGTLSI